MLSSQISVPITDSNSVAAVFLYVCVFERQAMWLHIVFALCTHWGVTDLFFFVCGCAQTWTCTYMCEPRAVMLGLLHAFSSPVGQFCAGEDGRLLWRKLWEFSCPCQLFLRYTSRLRNSLMNNTSSTEQVCFCMERKCVWRHMMYSSHDTVSGFHLFDSVCVLYIPLIRAAVGGEKSVPCQAHNSQIWALSGCVDTTLQNPPTSPIFPPSVWTPVSLPAASWSVSFPASGSTN